MYNEELVDIKMPKKLATFFRLLVVNAWLAYTRGHHETAFQNNLPNEIATANTGADCRNENENEKMIARKHFTFEL